MFLVYVRIQIVYELTDKFFQGWFIFTDTTHADIFPICERYHTEVRKYGVWELV